MADDNLEMADDEMDLAPPADTAIQLTSGIVIATFVIGLIAFLMMQKAMGKWYGIGMFGG